MRPTEPMRLCSMRDSEESAANTLLLLPEPLSPLGQLEPDEPLSPPVTPVSSLAQPGPHEPRLPLSRPSLNALSLPPPVTKHGRVRLLEALRRNSLEQTRQALAAEPDAIENFYFDANFETALNTAICFFCSPAIIQLLIEHGADPCDANKEGSNAMTCLSSLPTTWLDPRSNNEETGLFDEQTLDAAEKAAHQRLAWMLRVAGLLLSTGGTPDSRDSARRTPAEVATANENRWLVRYWTYCWEVQASVLLHREAGREVGQKTSMFSKLSPPLVPLIVGFLLPASLSGA